MLPPGETLPKGPAPKMDAIETILWVLLGSPWLLFALFAAVIFLKSLPGAVWSTISSLCSAVAVTCGWRISFVGNSTTFMLHNWTDVLYVLVGLLILAVPIAFKVWLAHIIIQKIENFLSRVTLAPREPLDNRDN